MLTRLLIPLLLVLIPMGLGYWVWQSNSSNSAASGMNPAGAWIAPSEGQAYVDGKNLYDQFCASCHGVSMQGQFNWQQRLANGRLPAPPHDESGHTWHHPDWQLAQMIKIGFVGGVNAPDGYESDMPGFADVLSDDQIDLILAYIKTFWPDEILQALKEISLQPRTQ